MRRALLSILTIISSLAWLLIPQPALAAMLEPLSVSIYDKAVYRHLLEDDDFLFILPYSVTYAATPDVNIDKAFIFEMYDPTGATLLGSALTYPYQDRGYGPGIVSFYFAASSGPVWDAANIVRVLENPSQFDTPVYWDFPMSAADYSTAATQATNQAELRTKIQAIATDLGISWTLTLLTQDEEGITLSSYGEDYFRNSILGLQTMCLALFSVQMATPDFSDTSWEYTVANTFLTRYTGTFIGNAMTGFAGLTSADTNATMNTIALLFFAALICFEMAWTKNKQSRGYQISSKPFAATIYSASMDGFALLILMTLYGAFSMVLNGLMAFLAIFILGVVMLLNRS